jgi:K+-sensing histidine kinase KdpD
MVFESFRSVLAEVDEIKMSLVFTNPIENAIKYNKEGGMVKVSLNSDHRYFYVRVEDTGIGIPEEAKKFICLGQTQSYLPMTKQANSYSIFLRLCLKILQRMQRVGAV